MALDDAQTNAATTQSAQTLRGIIFAVVALFVFSVQDAVVKALAADYSVVQILCLRSITMLIAAVVWIRLKGDWSAIRTKRLGAHLVRAALIFVAFLAFYVAVTMLPLATVVALVFSAPLITTVLSIPLLKERVGPHRWAAVGFGFIGVLIMMRPRDGAFEWALLLCLVASLGYALSLIQTRRIGTTESTATMVFYAALILFIGPLLLLPGRWVTPDAVSLAAMLGIGLLSFFGHIGLTEAYRIAPAAAVAPFDYSMLVWAVLWGFLFWREVPDPITMAGAGLVILGGLYQIHREARLTRRSLPRTRV